MLKQMCIHFDEETLKKLDNYAKKNSLTRSSANRFILIRFFNEKGEGE